MNRQQRRSGFSVAISAVLLSTLSTLCLAAENAAGSMATASSSLYLKVQLPAALKISKLKPGEVVEGKLARDVYSSDHELFPAGSEVRLAVDHLERRKRPRNDHWPWAVMFFTPRHENYPAFKNATVVTAGGESSLNVSVISVSRKRDVHAQSGKKQHGPLAGDQGAVEVSRSNAKSAAPVMVLEASAAENFSLAWADESAADDSIDNGTASSDSRTLPAGMRCKLLLLGNVSASKSKPGDPVQARLLEPVFLNSRVALPAGTLFEGKVIKKTPPRWLSRAGSLHLAFTRMSLPNGTQVPIAATLAGVEVDRASHTRMDAEGQLRGERPGKVWMAINLGVSAGMSKEIDDGLQLVIETIVSTATDVSTAGTARIAASCASGLYMVTRHGRDVVLPRFTEMDISLDRPVSLKPLTESAAMGAAGGK